MQTLFLALALLARPALAAEPVELPRLDANLEAGPSATPLPVLPSANVIQTDAIPNEIQTIQGVAPQIPTQTPAASARQQRALAVVFAGGAPAQVQVLGDGLSALQARAEMFDGARRTLVMSNPFIGEDSAGLAQLYLLREAARRGVKTRLVMDWWQTRLREPAGARLSKALLRHLADEGVEIRYFHRLSLSHLSRFPQRLHDKVVVADDEELITGDRNGSKHYFDGGPTPWRSLEVRARGAAAATAGAFLQKLWNSERTSSVRGISRVAAADAAAAGEKLDEAGAALRKRIAGVAARPWRDVAAARFSHDEPGGKSAESGTARHMEAFFNAAERTIAAANAYVILPWPLRRALMRARISRKVDVSIVTNSPQSNNIRSVRLAYESGRSRLARTQADIWEYQGPGTLHAKSAVVDGRYSYVGSFNLDPRSSGLNTESGLFIDDAGVAADVMAHIDKTRGLSLLVAAKGRWIGKRVVDWIWILPRLLVVLFLGDQV